MVDKYLPLVSIVTPAYNQARFLEETIQSVLCQDYPHIEYVVIDDGSTDNTPAILQKYTGKLIWESQSNIGQTPTINKGWRMSHGEFIAYINSDDTYVVPNAVRKGIEFLLAHPDISMVYGDAYQIDENSQIVERRSLPEFDYAHLIRECDCYIIQPSTFIRRAVLDDIGYLDPALYYAMDLDYWLHLGLKHKIAHLPEPLSHFRFHNQAKGVAMHAKNAPDYIYIYEKIFGREDLPEGVRKLRRQAMSSAYLKAAISYHMALDYQQSRFYMLKGLRYYPLNLSWLWIKRLLITYLKKGRK